MLRVVLVVALLVVSSRANAGPAEADKLAAQAKGLVKEGKFREAAKLFTQAAKEDPTRPEHFCNIGIAYYLADDYGRAHLVLGRCLLEQSALEADFVAKAKAALESVETNLRAAGHTPVEVTVTPPGASVRIVEFELDEAFVGRRVVWLPFGKHHLTARAEGYRDQTVEIETSTKDPKSVKIDLERDSGVRPIDPPKVRPPMPPPRKHSPVPAIVASVGTVGVAGLAGFAVFKARVSADRAATALDNDAHAADKRSVDRWNATFAISTSLAAAGVVISGYFWYRSTKPIIEIAPTSGGASVSVRGRF